MMQFVFSHSKFLAILAAARPVNNWVVMDSDSFHQLLVGIAFRAEMLAGIVGVHSFERLPDGSAGIAHIGLASEYVEAWCSRALRAGAELLDDSGVLYYAAMSRIGAANSQSIRQPATSVSLVPGDARLVNLHHTVSWVVLTEPSLVQIPEARFYELLEIADLLLKAQGGATSQLPTNLRGEALLEFAQFSDKGSGTLRLELERNWGLIVLGSVALLGGGLALLARRK